MKKSILLIGYMLILWGSAFCQRTVIETDFIDDSVIGSDTRQHNYVGPGWVHGTHPIFLQGTLSYSNVGGAYLTISFVGNKIEWFSEKKYTHGIAAVSLDGGPEQLVDLYASNQVQTYVYSTNTLAQGTHTLKIRVTGQKNPASTGYYVLHDAFLISTEVIVPGAESDSTNTFAGVGAMENWGILGIPSSGSGRNTAFGFNAVNSTFQSWENTGVGSNALVSSFQASTNVAIGANTIGSALRSYYNTALGYSALAGNLPMGHGGNTAVGAFAFDFASPRASNTAVGYQSGPAANDVYGSVALGANTKTTTTNEVRIGNASVTSIGGEVSWSTLSDGRFKKDIQEDISGLPFVKGLRPVSYTIDKAALRTFLGEPEMIHEHDAESKEIEIRQTGFVAQEVDTLVKKSKYVFNGVDVPSNDKDPYAIRYEEFVVPLVKAVQELSALDEEQQKRIDQQQEQINQLVEHVGKRDDLSASEISLFQNTPNPFSANTEIKMFLPESVNNVNVIVYNLEGKQLKEMTVSQRGKANVTMQGKELPAGMYIYVLIADGKVIDTKRMILTK